MNPIIMMLALLEIITKIPTIHLLLKKQAGERVKAIANVPPYKVIKRCKSKKANVSKR